MVRPDGLRLPYDWVDMSRTRVTRASASEIMFLERELRRTGPLIRRRTAVPPEDLERLDHSGLPMTVPGHAAAEDGPAIVARADASHA